MSTQRYTGFNKRVAQRFVLHTVQLGLLIDVPKGQRVDREREPQVVMGQNNRHKLTACQLPLLVTLQARNTHTFLQLR